MNQPNISLNQPNISLNQPNISLNQPNISLNQLNIWLRQYVVILNQTKWLIDPIQYLFIYNSWMCLIEEDPELMQDIFTWFKLQIRSETRYRFTHFKIIFCRAYMTLLFAPFNQILLDSTIPFFPCWNTTSLFLFVHKGIKGLK